jgi:hypothetical protein
MLSLILPPANRGRRLLSFWLVMSFLIGVLTSFVLLVRGSAVGGGFSLLLIPALFVPIWFHPELASFPYRAWNKMARAFGYHARQFILGTIFYVILIAVGRSGSLLQLAKPSPYESLWIPREPLAPAAYHVEHKVPMEQFLSRGWLHNFLLWASKSGNFWLLFLLPFLLFLSAFDTEQEESYPAGIYTLF